MMPQHCARAALHSATDDDDIQAGKRGGGRSKRKHRASLLKIKASSWRPNVANVHAALRERRELLLGALPLRRQARGTMRPQHFLERGVHVARHALPIAADVDVGALLKHEARDARSRLADPLLHIDLLLLVARERCVQRGEETVASEPLQLGFEDKVRRRAAAAEEKVALNA